MLECGLCELSLEEVEGDFHIELGLCSYCYEQILIEQLREQYEEEYYEEDDL